MNQVTPYQSLWKSNFLSSYLRTKCILVFDSCSFCCFFQIVKDKYYQGLKFQSLLSANFLSLLFRPQLVQWFDNDTQHKHWKQFNKNVSNHFQQKMIYIVHKSTSSSLPVKFMIRCYICVPDIRVFNGKPFPTEPLNFWDIGRIQKS